MEELLNIYAYFFPQRMIYCQILTEIKKQKTCKVF